MTKMKNNGYKEEKKSFKEEMLELILEGLEKDGIHFVKTWSTYLGAPEGYVSQSKYTGMNALKLTIETNQRHYTDNRWLTFNQIKENNFHLEKGSKGVRIQFTMPYDEKTHKIITWKEYEKLTSDMDLAEKQSRFSVRNRHYVVFNASNVVGIEPKKHININNIQKEELVERISSFINVPIKEGGNKAAYVPSMDYIKMPPKEHFVSQGSYAAVCLHELGHATGHESRLDRKIANSFGTKDYAKEELVAELTSCFLSEYIQETLDDEILENHQGYVKSWIKGIQDDPDYFKEALKDAIKATQYIEEHAHLQEWKKEQEQNLEQEALTVEDDEFEF